MILKASQRGGAGQLAQHLLNDLENDHVAVEELRGFMSSDLPGALAEAHAVSKGTQCKQFMFSLSLNPPKDQTVSLDALRDAADRAEAVLGLSGQPRAFIIHEKNGRRHAHVVWSRIDANEMKAINLPFFKNRLAELSRDLYLEHGWELPEGHRTNDWKNPLNFSRAEWEQCKRLGLDPREIRQVFAQALGRSDNLASFRNALEEHGFYLARGDSRAMVAVDVTGSVYAVARYAGLKTKDLKQQLGEPETLPSVDAVKETIRARTTERLKALIREDRQEKQSEFEPLAQARRAMVVQQRLERARLARGQKQRLERETKERAARFRSGFRGAFDLLTGRRRETRRLNELEAWQGHLRDRRQREDLFSAHIKDRRTLQKQIEVMQARHRFERMRLVRSIADAWKEIDKGTQPGREARTTRRRSRGHERELGL